MAEENQSRQGAGTGSADPQNAVESSKTHARKAAEDLRTAATQMAGEYRGKAEQAWEDASGRVRTFQEDGEQYVRDNPTKAVFTALGIGFVLGIVFRR
ncbi:MAG: YqjD family protein [Chthoniobacterales bacterium]